MCGIAGGFRLDGSPVDPALLTKMTEAQHHRGPDDGGLWCDGPIGFGHRRLSIIDLSPAGHQPMFSTDGRYVITFNGEIYNYIELRSELESAGHHFRSRTDTEVLLAAYQAWGPACVDRFLGMWAFAIWDRKRDELFCSRDPFGIKPLFYARQEDRFYFASDLRALLQVPGVSSTPDWDFLLRQLTANRYRRVEETSFQDLRALPPGHNVHASRSGIRMRRYWNYSVDEARARYDYSDAVGTFRELLSDSIKLHFRSDVPVGVCLSGGLDSSSIVALASNELDADLHTFSIVYPGTSWSEDEYVDEVNTAFGCTPHLLTPPGRSDFLDTLTEMIEAHGEPDQGIGVYSQWKVMELAEPSVTVLLDGQGGDELLAGYRYYYPTYVGGLLRSGRALSAWREYSAYREYSRTNFGRSVLKAAFPLLDSALRGIRGDVDRRNSLAVLNDDVIPQGTARTGAVAAPAQETPDFRSPLGAHLYQTITTDLLQSLLYFEDRNSMAFSLEARVPFLDRRLVEFCLGLPPEMQLRDGYTKWILREALKDDLPESVRLRRDKKGYPTPFASWLRSGLMSAVREILMDRQTRRRNLFDLAVIEKRLVEHEQGHADHSVDIFNWITLELWFRRFGDRSWRPSSKPVNPVRTAAGAGS